MAVHIVDAIPGSGKSSAMINYINNAPADEKFLYITPYLEEVERIKENCMSKNFEEPQLAKGCNKSQDIRQLFKQNKNVVSTHSLFMRFNTTTSDYIKNNNYTLIIDEVAQVIQILDITKYDFDIIKKMTTVGENGNLVWLDKSYDGVLNKYKYMCDMNCLTMYGDSVIIWMFPVEVFKYFKNVYILTYLFESQMQKYYYDYHKIKYDYFYIKGTSIDSFEITQEVQPVKHEFAKLITILDNKKLNSIGDDKFALSKSWYLRTSGTDDDLLEKLKKNTYNFFKNYTRTKSSDNIWSTFKSFRTKLAGKGYSKGFVSLNARATNKYKDTCAAAYLVNTFMNPVIKKFFSVRGIEIDEDCYALSELLQWLWRTRIRNSLPITVYIPSSRMRNLLINWIKEEQTNE